MPCTKIVNTIVKCNNSGSQTYDIISLKRVIKYSNDEMYSLIDSLNHDIFTKCNK